VATGGDIIDLLKFRFRVAVQFLKAFQVEAN
jgi:hypothetical protein